MEKSFNIDEFLDNEENPEVEEQEETTEETAPENEELNIQKVVVEELAADKASLEMKIASLEKELSEKKEELESRITSLQSEIKELIDKEEKEQPRNPNALALLDRDIELRDRFPGETRDHVLEVLAEAREAAEKDGRLRRAQILESVLVANEPSGELAKRREELSAIFAANNNLITGEVLEELKKRNISHKAGEEYLLPSEIMKRIF